MEGTTQEHHHFTKVQKTFFYAICASFHAWSFFRKYVYYIPKEHYVVHVPGMTSAWKTHRTNGRTIYSSRAEYYVFRWLSNVLEEDI